MIRLLDLFPILGEASKNLIQKASTVRYPSEHIEIPDHFRGAPEVNPALCIVCKICERNCPSHCISITPVDSKDQEKISQNKGKVFLFSINIAQCMFCQQCEESCPQGQRGRPAITLNSNNWRIANHKIENLIESKFVFQGPKKNKETTERKGKEG